MGQCGAGAWAFRRPIISVRVSPQASAGLPQSCCGLALSLGCACANADGRPPAHCRPTAVQCAGDAEDHRKPCACSPEADGSHMVHPP
eukprot:1645832-Pyramimonas_sp.AAC.1